MILLTFAWKITSVCRMETIIMLTAYPIPQHTVYYILVTIDLNNRGNSIVRNKGTEAFTTPKG